MNLTYIELGGLPPGAFEEKYGPVGNLHVRRLLETAESFDFTGKNDGVRVTATLTVFLAAYYRYCDASGYDEAQMRELFEQHMSLRFVRTEGAQFPMAEPSKASLPYTHVATMLKKDAPP